MMESLFTATLCQLGWMCGPQKLADPWLLPKSVTATRLAPIAQAVEVSGTVLIKRFDDSNWLGLGPREKLFLGDSLQTFNNSKIKIEYIENGASLVMTQSSYYRLESKAPGFSRFKKQNGISNSKLKTAGETSILSSADNQGRQNDQGSKAEVFGMSLQQEVTQIQILEPAGDVIILTSKLPVTLNVTLDPALSLVKFLGFVWRDAIKKDKPVWTGFFQGSFSDIPFKKYGEYLVQIIGEDEFRSSKPLKVKVVAKTPRWIEALSTESSSGPVVLEIR